MRIKGLLVIISIAFCIGCNDSKSDNDSQSSECEPYFNFDEVTHYTIDFPDDSLWAIEDKENKTPEEKRILDILWQDMPAQIKDSSLVIDLEKIGFSRYIIDLKFHNNLEQIFCERKHEDAEFTACVAVYRDILVFRNKNKIVGVAKICFECYQNFIVGTSLNTENFGQSGDYHKLGWVLNENRKD